MFAGGTDGGHAMCARDICDRYGPLAMRFSHVLRILGWAVGAYGVCGAALPFEGQKMRAPLSRPHPLSAAQSIASP